MQRNDSLRALLAIQHAGSIAKAAKQTQKSTSQLSHAISCLEEDLGLTLLNRDSYRATLTGQGEFIAAQSRYLLDELQSLDRKIVNLAHSEGDQAQLRLGFLDALPLSPYSDTLWQLQQLHPQLRVHVEHLHTKDVVLQLEQGELDFGIAFFHCNSQPHLNGHLIGLGEILTVVAPHHPLAAEDLAHDFDARNRYLQLSPTSYLGIGLDMLAQSSANYWQLDNYELMVELLEQGMGWADLPRHWVDEKLRSGKLIRLNPGRNSTFWSHPQLLWHKDRKLSATDRWLIDQLSRPRPGLAVASLPM